MKWKITNHKLFCIIDSRLKEEKKLIINFKREIYIYLHAIINNHLFVGNLLYLLEVSFKFVICFAVFTHIMLICGGRSLECDKTWLRHTQYIHSRRCGGWRQTSVQNLIRYIGYIYLYMGIYELLEFRTSLSLDIA